MMSLAPAFIVFSLTLLLSALLVLLLPLKQINSRLRLFLPVIIAVLLLIPGLPYPPWFYVRSISGDPSILGLCFYFVFVLNQYYGIALSSQQELVMLRISVLLLAVCLYPLALGLSPFDSYAIGYANPWFISTLLIATLAFVYKGYYFIAVSLTLAFVSFSFALLDSRNLWDYLIDPIFILILLFSGLKPYTARRQ